MPAQIDDDTGFITLGEVAGGLRRKWYVVAASTLVGVLLGGALMTRSSDSYTSEAQLVIDPITTDPFAANSRPVDAVNPETERSVLRGSEVAQQVVDELELDTTASQLLNRVTVENPEGSLALKVSVQATTAARAQALANAFAATYLEQRSDNAQEAISALVSSIDAELAATKDRLAEAIASAEGLAGNTFAGQQVEAEISTLRTRIASLEERRTELLTTSTSPGRITREADLPGSTDGLPSLVLLAGVVAFTTTLGGVLAVLLDRRGGKVKDASAFEALVPGAQLELIRDQTDLEGVVGSAILAAQSTNHQAAPTLYCTEGNRASLSLTTSLVRGLSGAGLRTLVLWTGENSLPTYYVVRNDLEILCSGEMSPVDASEDPVLWILPSNRGGTSVLAREDLPANVTKWAEQSGYDVVLVSTPSPWLQPAVAGLARRAHEVNLLIDCPPRRRDLASTVKALGSVGVGVSRTIVVLDPDVLIL
jgi:capsular polysaccharide biosynthesis protein